MEIISILKTSLVSVISSLVRTLLVWGLTWLVTRNLIEQSISDQLLLVGPIAVAAILWSLIEKYVIGKLHLERLVVALNLPEGSTQENLKDALKKSNADTPTV